MHLRLNEWVAGSPLSAAVPALRNREIQLWTAGVPASDEGLLEFNNLLAPAERTRAARFSNPFARREFVFGRGFLRMLLGECLRIEPGNLDFDTTAYGKPCLRPFSANRDLRFNLSHSGGRVVVALAFGRELGVDLEWIQDLEDWPSLSARIFSPRELAELNALLPEQRRRAFFNGWTRKEAFLKATGEGLSDNLQAIEVSVTPGRPPEWLALPGGPEVMCRWTVRDIPLSDGFAGALVYENTKPLTSSRV